MNDPISRAAFHWWAAECDANPSFNRKATPGDVLTRAVPRVKAIFAGEVRWSETGPGDKAVWKGRPRDIETFAALHGDLQERGQVEWLNLFDTIEMGPNGTFGERTRQLCLSHVRMFGNCNVGNHYLTNMIVAGQLCQDEAFDVRQAYAVVNRPITTTDDIVITLHVGYHPIGPAIPLREWILGIPVGIQIPPRQTFCVDVDARISPKDPLELIVHLEGTTRRRTW